MSVMCWCCLVLWQAQIRHKPRGEEGSKKERRKEGWREDERAHTQQTAGYLLNMTLAWLGACSLV